MQLDFFNNLLNNIKANNGVQNFIKELLDYLENPDNKKQEACIYQVVDIGTDGVYLQNVDDNKIIYETNISEDVLREIGTDTVLRYQKNKYTIDEELTEVFLNNLVGINEYEKIQNAFEKNSNILKNNPNTRYKLEKKSEKYCMLSYEKDKVYTLKVPKELIPFWTKCGDKLFYEKGKFYRDL